MSIFIIWTTTDAIDETHCPYSLYGQQPMLWLRHPSIIYSLYGQHAMLWMRHIDHIFIIWTTTDVIDETHCPYSLYGQQPMLWMRHTSIIYSSYGQQPMLSMRHSDHIFIIWTATGVMDETH